MRNLNSSIIRSSLILRGLGLATLLFLTGNIQAERILEVEGSAAIIAGAQLMAKENAIKNAMQQALLQTKAHINSVSTVSANVLMIDSARVNTSGTIENVKVLDEWVEDNYYFVRIRASIPEDQEQSSKASPRYRKKIAAIQFDILQRSQVYDLPDIERSLPRELMRRLDLSDNFITIDATQYLASSVHPGLRFDDPAAYKMIAEKTGAQIILSGQIQDMHVDEGLFQDTRYLEIEIYLHDGISGSRLSRHRFSEIVKNAGLFTSKQPIFSNSTFFRTVYGKTLNRILDTQIEIIENDLANIPFVARVLKLNGKQVYFNAGATSLVNIGDVLMTFRLEQDATMNLNQQFLGHMETPVASLSVEQVQPLFSIGKLEIKNAKLTSGDIVRFGD